jgi:hypothetical protein
MQPALLLSQQQSAHPVQHVALHYLLLAAVSTPWMPGALLQSLQLL